MNKLRQWGLAQTMYCQDNHDYIPRESAHKSSSWNNRTEAYNSAARDTWYNALPPVISQKAVFNYFYVRAGFYNDKSMFHCPNAKFPADPTITIKILYFFFTP